AIMRENRHSLFFVGSLEIAEILFNQLLIARRIFGLDGRQGFGTTIAVSKVVPSTIGSPSDASYHLGCFLSAGIATLSVAVLSRAIPLGLPFHSLPLPLGLSL